MATPTSPPFGRQSAESACLTFEFQRAGRFSVNATSRLGWTLAQSGAAFLLITKTSGSTDDMSPTPQHFATAADRLRFKLSQAIEDLNDCPPIDATERLLAVENIRRLRAELANLRGPEEPRHIKEVLPSAFGLLATGRSARR